jgi:hypothetical protein
MISMNDSKHDATPRTIWGKHKIVEVAVTDTEHIRQDRVTG